MKGRGDKTAGVVAGSAASVDDRALRRLEKEHAEGLTAAQVVEAFTTHGVHLSESTFRKWVQIGLLPRSRRVGRKGKHQGSRGLYPPAVLRRINQIKRLMSENLTIEEIGQSLQYRDQIETLERGLDELFAGLSGALAPAARLATDEQAALERLLGEAKKLAGDLIGRLETLERRVVTPLERAAKQRAFGAGTSGGAGDLL